MKIYPKTSHPKRDKNLNGEPLEMSVDVFVYSANKMLNIGFYNYDTKDWGFHTDPMEDMDNMDFVWCYPPKQLTAKYARSNNNIRNS